jgi:ERCC4-type nuclease
MEFELIVDNRESAVSKSLKALQQKFLVEQLSIGDFLIKRNEQPYALWERKTYSDLVASLKDSRFREQKHRMMHSTASIHGYIIEGSYPKGPINGIKPATIDSILLGLTLRDRYTVIYSTGPEHTAELLTKMLVKFNEWCSSTSVSPEIAHQDALIQGSTVKKDGLTVETCYLAQLAQIPGISVITARSISQKWPTLNKFLTFLQSPARETLSELLVNDKRLGVATAKRILTYLYDAECKTGQKVPKKIVVKLKAPLLPPPV